MRLADILAGLIAEEQPDITPEEAQTQAQREITELMFEIDQRLDQRAELEDYGQAAYHSDALEHLYTV